jgi:MFS family permease
MVFASKVHPALRLSLLIDSLGSGIFGPMILLYVHLVAGYPLAEVGGLASAAAVVGLVVPLFAGRLADRFEPRIMVVAGQTIQALGYAGFLVAREPWAIFIAFVGSAVGLRVFWSTFFTMLAALPVPEEGGRERLFAVTGMAQATGFGTGALIGGVLVANASVRIFEIAVICNIVSYLLGAALLLKLPLGARTRNGDVAATPSGLRLLLRNRSFLGLIVVDAGFAICSDALVFGLPISVKEGGIGYVGVLGPLLALNTFLIATTQLFVAKVIGRTSRVRALVIAGLLWVTWAILMSVLPVFSLAFSSAVLILLVLVYCAAEMIHAPVANALAAEAAPAEHRGVYLAAFQYGFAIANIVVPAAFTALFEVGRAVPWIALAVLAAAATAGASVVGRFLPAEAVHPVVAAR